MIGTLLTKQPHFKANKVRYPSGTARRYVRDYNSDIYLHIYPSGHCFLWLGDTNLIIERHQAYDLLEHRHGDWRRK